MNKVCSKCKIEKDTSEFDKRSNCPRYWRAECRKCCRSYSTKWARLNRVKATETARRSRIKRKLEDPDKIKRQSRGQTLRKYWPEGTWEEAILNYEDMLNKQDGVCAICKKPQSAFKKSMAVDHNHKTGRIRGILCFRCNKLKVGMHTIQTALEVYEYLCKYDIEIKDE